MIEITRNDNGTYNIKRVKQTHCICGCKLWDDGSCGCGIPEHHANDIDNHDVQFDDPELMTAEEIASLDEIPKPTICPGCGVKLDEDCCSVVDGTYHFGESGCADQAGEPGKEFFPIEFELAGKEGTRQGVCQGRDPQDAIKNFLENYSPSMGTIASIRVPEFSV